MSAISSAAPELVDHLHREEFFNRAGDRFGPIYTEDYCKALPIGHSPRLSM